MTLYHYNNAKLAVKFVEIQGNIRVQFLHVILVGHLSMSVCYPCFIKLPERPGVHIHLGQLDNLG